MSSSTEMRPRWRPMALTGGLVALVLAVVVACGGGDDSPARNTPEVIISTFTPTVEGATPPANATRDARATEAAATATYVAENPPPPPPTRDPNATQVVPTVDPDAEEGMRPPHVWLTDGNRTWDGVFGNFSFVEESTGTVASAQAPFYNVGDDGLTVAPGGELEVILQEDVEFPNTMAGPPESALVEVYTWENNNAIPTGTDGSVGDRPWFVPAEAPLISSPLNLDSPVLTMPAQPDRYVVRVQLTWPTFEHPDAPQPIPIYAVYAFTVYVE